MKTVTKSEVVAELANELGVSKAQASKAIDAFFFFFIKQAKKGNKVSFSGYMTIKKVQRKARKGFNPMTKKPITIPAKEVLKAVLGSNFNEKKRK